MFSSSQKPYNMHDKNNEFTKENKTNNTLLFISLEYTSYIYS